MRKPSSKRFWKIAKQQVEGGVVTLRDALDILLKATVDEKLIQRIFKPWNEIRKVGYLKSVFNGTNLTSVFVLADVNAILTSIKVDIEEIESRMAEGEIDTDDANRKITNLKENEEYFEKICEDHQFLLIDGKHRFELLKETFVDKTFKFTEDFRDMIRGGGVPVDITGRSLGVAELDGLADDLLDECEAMMCIIRNGDIASMQSIFVGSNSGLQLFPMELRICTMSILARFVRDLTDVQENPTIHEFMNALNCLGGDGEKSLIKKGDLLLISMFIAYYMNNIKHNSNPSKSFFSRGYLDRMYDYGFEISKADRVFIREVLHVIANGSLSEYSKKKKFVKKNNKNQSLKYISLKWSNVLNLTIITAILMSGRHPLLSSIGKKVKINDDQLFFRSIFQTLIKVMNLDLYELNANGDPLPKLDKFGNPTFKKGVPVYVENEHSFKRKDRNNTEDNQRIKMNIFMEYIHKNDLLTQWEVEGIITLVETTRTLSLDEKRYQAVEKQNGFDIFTKKRLSFGEIDSGLTVAAHTKAHSKGGTEMVVGDAKANLNQGTDDLHATL